MFPETIETPRLLLRKPIPADAEVIFRTYAQDTEVTRYLVWRPHTSVETTKTFLAESVAVIAIVKVAVILVSFTT